MASLDPEQSEILINSLAGTRFCVLPHALPDSVIEDLRERAYERTDFRAARIGRVQTSAKTVRNDEIAWLDEKALDASEIQLFSFFESVRLELNRKLYLGLVDFEAHYARYKAGHFYARHVDRFSRGSGPSRAISMVLYLNEHWTTEDGGVLRLHLSPPIDVLPVGGTLVCFTSDEVEHEVLPARRERLSIAAWFRQG